MAGFVLVAATLNAHQAPASEGGDASALKQLPAVVFSGARNAAMLAAHSAGKRVVAVGDHGIVLLSDDGGASYRQAKSVPTRATLNSVVFVDEKEGWAVGHWGVVLHTGDGGDTWSLQRSDFTVDQPLFTVWFRDRQTGFAAGLWSLMLSTQDGGKTWNQVKIPAPAGALKGDRNLFQIFSDGKGSVFIAAEQGVVYRSPDGGQHWEAISTGNRGTFWTGIVLDNGSILVAGLSGKVFRSGDGGKTWAQVETGTRSSITSLAQLPDGNVFAVGLDGVSLVSRDRGMTFTAKQREDRLSFTAVTVNRNGQPIAFSKHGPVTEK